MAFWSSSTPNDVKIVLLLYGDPGSLWLVPSPIYAYLFISHPSKDAFTTQQCQEEFPTSASLTWRWVSREQESTCITCLVSIMLYYHLWTWTLHTHIYASLPSARFWHRLPTFSTSGPSSLNEIIALYQRRSSGTAYWARGYEIGKIMMKLSHFV